MFRRFEFRNLLGRVDELDAALPARPMRVEGTEVEWREGALEDLAGRRIGLAIEGGRFAVATEEGVVVGEWRPELEARLRDAEIVAHDFKSLPRLTMQPTDDTMIPAYLIEPSRPPSDLGELAAGTGPVPVPG